MRGESNVQGSTDFGLTLRQRTQDTWMFQQLLQEMQPIKGFLDRVTPKSGYWVNKPKFLYKLC